MITINASIREPDNARDFAVHGNVRLQRHLGAKSWILAPHIENKIIECVGAISGPDIVSSISSIQHRWSMGEAGSTPQFGRYEHTARVTEIVRAFAR